MWYNVNRNGRLGNRLFSRAHVYAAALEFGATVVDWGLQDCRHLFPRIGAGQLPTYPLGADDMPPDMPRSPLANSTVLSLAHRFGPRRTGPFGPFWNHYHYDRTSPETVRLDGPEFRAFVDAHPTVILNGFKFRCPGWVAKHRDEICRYFELPEAPRLKWAAQRDAWRTRFGEVIGLHLRQTDFAQAAGGRYFLTLAEVAGLVRETAAFDPASTLFVIFSDSRFDRPGDKAILDNAFQGLNVTVNGGDMVDDLCGMMACDRLIGPMNSTFSRWAAFAGSVAWAGVSRELLAEPSPLVFQDTSIPWDY